MCVMEKIKKYIKISLQLSVSVVAFYYLYNKFDIDLISTIKATNLWFLLLACAIRIFISPLIYINRWKLFLEKLGVYESFGTLLKISMMSAFIGVILPSSQGADLVRMVMIEKRHPSISLNNKMASSTILVERVIGFFIFALLGLFFSLVCSYPEKDKVVFCILTINIFIWLTMFILTNRFCYKYTKILFEKIKIPSRILLFIDKMYNTLVEFPYKEVLLSSFALILLLQIVTILILYCVFLSFGVNLPLYQHFAFYPIISILSIIPISIGGLGLREGFFVSFYSLLGVNPSIAISVSLINYLIEIVMFALFGGVVYALKSLNIIKV